MTIREKLEEKYFDKLEKNLVEFTETQTHDQGYSETIVKDKYLHASVEEMCQYLEMPQWVIEWTLDLIEAEEQYIDTATEYNMVKNEPMTKESEVL